MYRLPSMHLFIYQAHSDAVQRVLLERRLQACATILLIYL